MENQSNSSKYTFISEGRNFSQFLINKGWVVIWLCWLLIVLLFYFALGASKLNETIKFSIVTALILQVGHITINSHKKLIHTITIDFGLNIIQFYRHNSEEATLLKFTEIKRINVKNSVIIFRCHNKKISYYPGTGHDLELLACLNSIKKVTWGRMSLIESLRNEVESKTKKYIITSLD